MKTLLIIVGSASNNSANHQLAKLIAGSVKGDIHVRIYTDLKMLPPFDPEQSVENTPQPILDMRHILEGSDAIIFCTPEYVFSIPSGLKNLIEWCVSTTLFQNKPLGILTASAHGKKGHEELQRIMQTLMARFTPETTLLIQGIRGKLNADGTISHAETGEQLHKFSDAVQDLMNQQEIPLH